MKRRVKNKSKANYAIKHRGSNLALISIILGATSFLYTIFTGIPAIIIGIIALKHKSGDQLLAKLGIIFGVIGSLLLIPLILLLMAVLREPLQEQRSISSADRANVSTISINLEKYKETYRGFPDCDTDSDGQSCKAWQKFYSEYPGMATYPTAFETAPYQVEDRAAGSLVVAYNTTCFIGIPVDPTYENDNKTIDTSKYLALVFFYEGGRACFPIRP